ncbi:MAG TPA: magnesium transporter CorA [Dehalococcoidia bacterium]|nr:magnesium transporter CorA [Dehalococcoidia bacterium]
MSEEVKAIKNTALSGDSSKPIEKRWFFAALHSDGSVMTDYANSPTNFLNTIKTATLTWVDFLTANFEEDSATAATLLGFSNQLTSSLTEGNRILYEDFETEIGIKLPSVQIRIFEHPEVQPHKVLLLMQKNLLLTIHPLMVDRRFSRLRRYSPKILRKIPIEACDEDRLTLLLIRIIDQNNDRNFEHLRQIEEHGDDLNRSLMDPKTPRDLLGPQIYGMKHALIVYLDALWETVDVLHDLRYGDAELLTNDSQLLDRIGYLAEDVNRQIGLAEHMSEVLASGLEVLQSIYNNQLQALNNRMAMVMTYLTVLGTAILVPNTLATVMSNPAFAMEPKDAGWYLTLLISSTIIATALSFWWVKRKGWLPKKID